MAAQRLKAKNDILFDFLFYLFLLVFSGLEALSRHLILAVQQEVQLKEKKNNRKKITLNSLKILKNSQIMVVIE